VTRVAPLPQAVYEDVVRGALLEDLGRGGDITTDAIVDEDARGQGRLVMRAAGCVAGLDIGLLACHLLDPHVTSQPHAADGDDVGEGAVLATVAGPLRALLSAERTALNLVSHLSGIATETRRLVLAVAGHRAVIADTRKTTPGLRTLEKYAVRVGGGTNHRLGLDDAVLIKDNHLLAAGTVASAVKRARARVGHLVKVEVEADSLDQVDEALAAGADAVLLDNMTPEEIAAAVEKVGGRMVVEASGGITPETVDAVAAAGVDVISLGWITHSAPALDVAFDLDN
jgi:nicotinate-nucleotide pyrophosphorylase (carboxylating)